MLLKSIAPTLSCNSTYRLRYWNLVTPEGREIDMFTLQQYLPFTVLKLEFFKFPKLYIDFVATVPTVYGIETNTDTEFNFGGVLSCNSTYRLRYWNYVLAELIHDNSTSCNSTYRLRYWNNHTHVHSQVQTHGCNSTYRLRYWNLQWLQVSSHTF